MGWIFVKRTYLRVCWRSTIDLCVMNLPKRLSFKSLPKVYTLSKVFLWIKPSCFSLETVCHSWCTHQTGLFSSASVVPQSKYTELGSSAAPYHDDIFGTRQTNILAQFYLFGKTWPAYSSATQATEINILDQITGKVIDMSRTYIPLNTLMIPLKRVKLRGAV